MSTYKEGQHVSTPQGQGRIAADQINEQVYVLLTESGSIETFDEREVSAATMPDIAGDISLPASEAKNFDFDDFLNGENKEEQG
ncbi:hypothetical protein [Mucilaginibacter sp.]